MLAGEARRRHPAPRRSTARAGSLLGLLDLLDSQKETAPAARVWTQLAQLRQPLPPQLASIYIRYLVGQHEVDQARLVWQQAATSVWAVGLSAFAGESDRQRRLQPERTERRIRLAVYQSKEVSLALDPTQSHGGHRSLLITFDAQKIDDAGIGQLVPVQPSTGYDFSAYFKASDIQGAGGPRFAIQDLYTATTYFASDQLKNADFWKQVSGSFTTGPDTKLLLLRIQREPPGMPIRGKLWIDTVRLAGQEQEQAQ